MTSSSPVRLSRASGHGRPAAPVRIVHLGVGNFFRAHQAWYTEHAPDAAEWGIAAFTGRSPAMADALRPQDGLYTLITRGTDGDSYEVVSTLSAVHSSSEHEAFLAYQRSPGLAIVTLTVTEAGYLRGPGGHLDLTNPGVVTDIQTLRADPQAPVATTPGRIVAGLPASALHHLQRDGVAAQRFPGIQRGDRYPLCRHPAQGGVQGRKARGKARRSSRPA